MTECWKLFQNSESFISFVYTGNVSFLGEGSSLVGGRLPKFNCFQWLSNVNNKGSSPKAVTE